jgi:hypothetical protein
VVNGQSNVTFSDIYNNGWFRNNNAGQGLYNQATGRHFYSPGAGYWHIDSSNGLVLYNQYNSSTGGATGRQGYLYFDGSGFGLLHRDGGWAVRTNPGEVELYGVIYASDVRSNIFYDRQDTGYYIDPNSTSRMNISEHIGRIGYNNYIVSRNQGGLMGDYNSSGTATKVIWTIGESWPLGNMYGLAYEYGSGYDHHLALRNNGTTYSRFGFAGGMFLGGTGTAGGDFRAPIFYDSNDTGFYVDPNGRRNTQINGFTDRTKATLGLTGKYPLDRLDYTGDTNYWTGIMGWGTTDLNSVMTWGSGFFDTWSNPANQPSGTSHWVGVQAYHYTNAYNSGYGWQIAGGPISNLRFRNSWPGNSGWTTIAMHDRNDGSGGALYAGIYYDSNNTGYYVNPDGTTYLNVLTANSANITAQFARWADVAEKYEADAEYEPGTVLSFGGSNEVTISTETHCSSVAGVVSTNPALLMNNDLESTFVANLALTGRVPCKVLGPVRKGQMIVASHIPGVGMGMDKALYEPGCIIGKSIEAIEDTEIKVIEVVVGRM